MGVPAGSAHGSIRLTIGERTTDEDVDFVITELTEIVKRLRSMSPLTPKELR